MARNSQATGRDAGEERQGFAPSYSNSWMGLTPAARMRSRWSTAVSAVLTLSASVATRSCTPAASSKRPWHTVCKSGLDHHFATHIQLACHKYAHGLACANNICRTRHSRCLRQPAASLLRKRASLAMCTATAPLTAVCTVS